MARKRKSQRARRQGSLFKRTANGPWIARWFDHSGRRREASTKTTDKAAAERILAKNIADAALRKDGVVDARADRHAENARKPLTVHLADFIAGVKARGVTAQQAQQLETRITRALNLSRAERIADLNPHAVQMAIADIRKGDDEHKPASIQTAKHYLRNMRQFTRWLAHDKRVSVDPLAGMEQPGNPDTDRKRIRRALTDEEIELLILTTEQGPRRRKMSGTDRAMMYRVAVGTGFRASEVKSLTPEAFDLQADPPTVTVAAAYSKHRQTDVQPIRPELADLLADWLPDKPAGEPVFKLRGKAVNVLRADLDAARAAWLKNAPTPKERTKREQSSFLRYVDEAGRVADFHSLRHTFISRLVAGGASVKTCQELARHSNPLLTIGRYSHVRLNDLTAALDVLPCPAPTKPDTERAALQATGTDNITAKCDEQVEKPRPKPRQLGRETAVSSDTPRSTTPVFHSDKRDFDACAKKSPGRGNRGHRLAIAYAQLISWSG